MSSPNDFLAQMGIDPNEVDEFDDRQRKGGPLDRRVCICGHAINKHKKPAEPKDIPWKSGPTDGYLCKPNGGMSCACRAPLPVLLVSDTRTFLRRTEGGGALHALIRGLRNMPEKATAEWLIERTCARCDATGDEYQIYPVPLTKTGKLVFDGASEGYDRFLCQKCREEV
jgi:hypothetical protein